MKSLAHISLLAVLMTATSHPAIAQQADAIYAKAVDDGVAGKKRCSITLVDGFRRLAMFQITLAIEDENTAYVEANGRFMIPPKTPDGEPALGEYFPVNDADVGVPFGLSTAAIDGQVLPVQDTKGIRYKASMRTTLNVMRHIYSGMPVTVAIRFDGATRTKSDVTIGIIFPEENAFFRSCFRRIDGINTAKDAAKPVPAGS